MHDFRHMAAGMMRPANADDPDVRILRRVAGPETFSLVAKPVGKTGASRS